MPSVLVVDDHDLMRSSLSRLIEAEADLVLPGRPATGGAASSWPSCSGPTWS